VHLAGAPAESMRLWSVAFSAVLTVLVAVYARRFLPLSGAILAGAIAALGYQLVGHGREMRPYALLALLVVVFALVLENAVALPTRGRLAALGATVLAGSLTHYFFLLAVATGLLWLWTLADANGKRLRISAVVGAALLPLVIWLPVTVEQAGRVNNYFGHFHRWSLMDLYGNLLASQSVWQKGTHDWRLAVLALVLWGTAVLARRPAARLVALMTVVPVALTTLVWVLGLHVFGIRNLIVVAPFAAIALAALPSLLPKVAASVAALAMLGAVVWMYSVDSQRGRTPFDRVGSAIADFGWTDADPIVLLGQPINQRAPLGWHLPGHPQLGNGTRTEGLCRRVYVVAESPKARAWVEARAGSILAQRSLPFYGPRPNGSRRSFDLLVAELPWSDHFLERDRPPGRLQFFYSRAGRPPACLRPWREKEPRSLF
jgi:hypothetical protein